MKLNTDKKALGEGADGLDGNHKILSHFVETSFGRIHVIQTVEYNPNLSPVICLHMSGHSAQSFRALIEGSFGKRRYIAFDYPGYGLSDLPPDNHQMSIAEYASIGWEVADFLGLDSVNLFGHHTGSKVAVEMNSQLTNRIEHIILAAVSISNTSTSNAQNPRVANELIEADMLWNIIDKLFGESASHKAKENMFREAIKAGPYLRSAQNAAIAYNEAFPQALSRLEGQVTVLNLNDDLRLKTPKIMPHMARGELIECVAWGHGFVDDHTEDVIALLERICGNTDCNPSRDLFNYNA